jgi:hypothetical protein
VETYTMPIARERVIPWMLGLALVAAIVGGFAGDAIADVYSGTLSFQGLPSANITITVIPNAGASYNTTFLGIPFDSGSLTAFVNGSRVTGALISNQFRPCLFAGTINGPTATLNLDPASCGGPGVLVVTRVA